MLLAGNYHLNSSNIILSCVMQTMIVLCVCCLPGMSEGTGPITLSTITDNRPGSVGKAYEGVEVRINDPDSTGQGEVNCESYNYYEYGLSCCVVLRFAFVGGHV